MLLLLVFLFFSVRVDAYYIVVIGDSIPEGRANTRSWPRVLCDELNQQTCVESGTLTDLGGDGELYTGSTYTVLNVGDTGDTVAPEILARYCADCVAYDPDAVVFHMGINDMRQATVATVTTILGTASSPGPYWRMLDDAYRINKYHVVVVSLSPWAGIAGWDGADQVTTEDLNTALAAWSDSHAGSVFVDIYSLLDAAPADDFLDDEWDPGDNVHPNDAGADLIGETVAAAFFL